MLMSTDVASIMLPVSRGVMERDIDTAAGTLANTTGGPGASVRGMKRGDPEPDAQTAAALTDLPGAECKRPRIDGTTVVDIGQVRVPLLSFHVCIYSPKVSSTLPFLLLQSKLLFPGISMGVMIMF